LNPVYFLELSVGEYFKDDLLQKRMICSVDTDVGHNLVTRQPIKSLPVCRTYQLWVGSDFEMSDCELILTSPVSERWFSP